MNSKLPINRDEFKSLYLGGIPTEEISKKYNVHRKTVGAWAKLLNLYRKAPKVKFAPYRGSANENLFTEINEETAYWIGFLMADGTIADRSGTSTIRLKLAGVDKNHILKFKDFTKSSNKLYHCPKNDYYQFQINGKEIGNRLKKFGIVPNKTFIAKVNYLEMNRHFWRGVIDGDGCLYIRTRKNKTIDNVEYPVISLVGSYDIINQFREFIKSIFPTFKGNVRKSENIFQIDIGSRGAKKVIQELYTNCETYLDRKYLKAQYIIENFNYGN